MLIKALCIDTYIVAMYWTTICIALEIDQRIVSTIHIARVRQKYIGLSMYIAATAAKDIDLASYITPSRPRVFKLPARIAEWLCNILNDNYRRGSEHCMRQIRFWWQLDRDDDYPWKRAAKLGKKGGKQTADRRRMASNSTGRRQALNTSQKTPN